MIDILLDDNMDLQLSNDLVIGESTLQHQQLLMLCNKGDLKENPTCGVGVAYFLKDTDESDLLATVKAEFQKDGMNVTSIYTENEKIYVDASY